MNSFLWVHLINKWVYVILKQCVLFSVLTCWASIILSTPRPSWLISTVHPSGSQGSVCFVYCWCLCLLRHMDRLPEMSPTNAHTDTETKVVEEIVFDKQSSEDNYMLRHDWFSTEPQLQQSPASRSLHHRVCITICWIFNQFTSWRRNVKVQICSTGNVRARTFLWYLHMAHVCTPVYSSICCKQKCCLAFLE